MEVYHNPDTDACIYICKVPSDPVLGSVEQCDGERSNQNGNVEVRYPCLREGRCQGLMDLCRELDLLLSLANQTFPSTLTGVGIFFGTRTWKGTELMAW